MNKKILALIFLLFSTPTIYAQWLDTQGPEGGYFTHITGTESKLFGVIGSNIYTSIDKGNAWTKRNEAGTKTFYTSSHVFIQTADLGGYLSSDGGETFDRVSDGLISTDLFSFVTVARDSLFALSSTKIMKLDPSTSSWSQVGTAAFGVSLSGTSTDLFAMSFGAIKSLQSDGTFANYGTGFTFEFPTQLLQLGDHTLMTTSNAIWKSGVDSVWSKKASALVGYYSLIEMEGSVFSLANNLTSLTLMTSADSGSTWTEVSIDSELKPISGYNNLFKAGSTLYATGLGQIPMKSDDKGKTWTLTTISGLKNPLISGLYTIDNTVYATSSASPGLPGGFGIYTSSDKGTSWELKNNGLVSTRVFRVRKIGSKLFAATVDGLHISSDNGASWTQIESTKGNTISDVYAVDENKLVFAGTKIWTTTDLGATLTQVLNATGTASLPMLYKANNVLFYGTFMSTDNGDTWIASPTFSNTSRQVFAVLNNEAFSIWGNALGQISFYKVNESNEWIKVETTGLSGYTISSLSGIDNHLYAYGTALAFVEGAFVYTYSIFKSSNGLDFEKQSDFETPIGGQNIYLAENETHLFAASEVSTVFRFSKNSTALEDQEKRSHFALLSNYPNPFNPSTTISYTLTESGFMQLEIFSTAGQLIKQIEKGVKSLGSYTVQFDATALASGVYLVRLKTSNQVQTNKITLIK